jgi:uncharacterized protein (DUF1778 family)
MKYNLLYNGKKRRHDMPSHAMNEHMNFRMSSHDKMTIETAAKLKGLKPQTYARQRLLEIAEKEIAETHPAHLLVLSDEDWKQFMAIMEAPVQINENLRKAIMSFKELNANY